MTTPTRSTNETEGRGPIRVMLAEDQDLVRAALEALLSLEPDLDVVASVGRGDEVLSAVQEHQPDVLLLDIEMPGMSGIEAAARVRAAGRSGAATHSSGPAGSDSAASTSSGTAPRIIIVTTFGRPGYVQRALDAGVSGFVVKDTPPDQLSDAIRRVHAGLRVIDPTLAQESLLAGTNPLTDREQDVLRAATGGDGPQEIAQRLHLSPGTVRNHLSSAIHKTGARNSFDAARVATERGWV